MPKQALSALWLLPPGLLCPQHTSYYRVTAPEKYTPSASGHPPLKANNNQHIEPRDEAIYIQQQENPVQYNQSALSTHSPWEQSQDNEDRAEHEEQRDQFAESPPKCDCETT